MSKENTAENIEVEKGWDTEMHEDIRKIFLKYFEQISQLLNMKIPRWYLCYSEGRGHLNFHVF